MAEFLAIHQTDAALLGCLLRQYAGKLLLGGATETAAGVAYAQSDDVLLRKRPLAEKPALPERLAEGVASEAAVIAAGTAIRGVRGAFQEESTFPFRFHRWMFSMAGDAEAMRPCRPKLHEGLPDYLRRSVRGEAAAQSLFFDFLSRLREAGRLDDGDVDEATVARSLAGAVGAAERVFEQLGQPMPPLAAVATNGRVMAAVRRGHPVWLGLREGIFGCPRCELPADAADNDPKVRAHRVLKAVVILTGEQAAPPEGFRPLEDGEVLAVSRALEVRRIH